MEKEKVLTKDPTLERIDISTFNDIKQKSNILMHIERYIFASKFVKDKTVLDIASGVGYGSQILIEKGKARHVRGCDIDYKAIKTAQDIFKNDKTDFFVMDATDLKLPSEFFQCVTSFETLEHVKDYKKMLTELHRVLIKNGILILSTPNKKFSTEDNEYHLKEFMEEELVEELEQLFYDVKIYYQTNGEKFSKLATKLHIRRFVKMIRGNIYKVNDKKGIGKQDPIDFIAVCRNKK